MRLLVTSFKSFVHPMTVSVAFIVDFVNDSHSFASLSSKMN